MSQYLQLGDGNNPCGKKPVSLKPDSRRRSLAFPTGFPAYMRHVLISNRRSASFSQAVFAKWKGAVCQAHFTVCGAATKTDMCNSAGQIFLPAHRDKRGLNGPTGKGVDCCEYQIKAAVDRVLTAHLALCVRVRIDTERR